MNNSIGNLIFGAQLITAKKGFCTLTILLIVVKKEIMEQQISILWVDDEIDLLKPYIIFLEDKGFDVAITTNGEDAIDLCKEEPFDIIFLDENMPGMTGLDTLQLIKNIQPSTPVVMITKSEEEDIMEEAIGSKIADYLIKPVNPQQILMTIKKNVQAHEIRSKKVTSNYQSEFTKLGAKINNSVSWENWIDIYKSLIHWGLELEGVSGEMQEILKMQHSEASSQFCKFISRNYLDWMTGVRENRPRMIHDIMKEKILPMLNNGDKIFFIVIDNLRLDQWHMMRKVINDDYVIEEDEPFFSILPTVTQYARNALFSGLMPNDIKQLYPQYWVDEDSEEGRNLYESELVDTFINRFRKNYSYSYHKINESNFGHKLLNNIDPLLKNDLNILVFNFIDMLSHTRTESRTIKELSVDESAYRELALSWFNHSSIVGFFKRLASEDYKVVVTTDHGSVRVQHAEKVVGDRDTNSNLRYKVGKKLSYNPRTVYEVHNPEQCGLPALNVSSKYIFCYNNSFFAYPNNFNHYVTYYKDTFQHGGVSMEEMIIPFSVLTPKKMLQ